MMEPIKNNRRMLFLAVLWLVEARRAFNLKRRKEGLMGVPVYDYEVFIAVACAVEERGDVPLSIYAIRAYSGYTDVKKLLNLSALGLLSHTLTDKGKHRFQLTLQGKIGLAFISGKMASTWGKEYSEIHAKQRREINNNAYRRRKATA